MNLTGYRTVTINGAVVVAVAALQYLAGIDWTQYVSPSVGVMIVGAMNLFLRYITTTPIGVATPPVTTLDSTKPKQGGFALAGFLWMVVIVLVMVIALGLTACASAPLPNQITAASLTIQDIAQQASVLERQHVITADAENSVLLRLSQANADLRQANALLANCKAPCTDVTALLSTINQTLISLQGELPAVVPTITPVIGESK